MSNNKKSYLSEPKITDKDSWWTGRSRIITFASLNEAHTYWERLNSGAIPTPDQVKEKIAELEQRCKDKEAIIKEDKETGNVLNHDKIHEDIRILMSKKLALSWVLGEITYL
jgi:hypothetical protein